MLSNNKCKIYIENIKYLEDEKVYNDFYNCISIERKKKIDAFKFEKDKKLSLLAEVLLKKGLNDRNIDINNCDFLYGDNGKPYIKNQKIFFNISHSGEYAMCAFADIEIGCDIEKIKDIDLNIEKRFFHHSEYENIMAQKTDLLKKDLFFRYWVLKESFMKVTGFGMSLPLDSFEIIIENNNIQVSQNINKDTYIFEELSGIVGYKASVCIKNN